MNNEVIKQSFLAGIVGAGLLFTNLYAAENQSVSTTETTMTSTTSTNTKSAGQAFLETNKTKPGVVTLPDGLQYKIIKEGTGPKPSATDTVTVNYKGMLIDGKEFDSSYKRGQPASFPVNAVIAGWTEALQKMPVGSTWELYIPADLAYGANGAPPVIGPDETLIFQVELLGINK